MKKFILFFLCAFTAIATINAQVKTPAASPSCKVEQSLGLSTVTLEFSRPSVKDRTVFGDLVPYDKMWRTGANKNTMITFSDNVNFGGTDVEAGTYAIFTTPKQGDWDWSLYSDTENWGTPEEWDDAKVAAKGTAKAMSSTGGAESFNVYFDNLRDESAFFVIDWAGKKVQIPVTLGTQEMVMKTIDKTMAGPSGNDYYNAARYYRENGKDLATALGWMDKALEIRGEKFWIHRQKALIQADMGDYAGAIKSAERSLELAKEENYDSYIKSNTESIKEWSMKK